MLIRCQTSRALAYFAAVGCVACIIMVEAGVYAGPDSNPKPVQHDVAVKYCIVMRNLQK